MSLGRRHYVHHPDDKGGLGICNGKRVYARILIRRKQRVKKNPGKKDSSPLITQRNVKKMEERIDDMEMPDVDDPEKKIALFQKKVAKVDEMEAFCAGIPGGQEYLYCS